MLRVFKYSIFSFFFLINIALTAQEKLPIQTTNELTELHYLRDLNLQKTLQEEIYKNSAWKRLVKNKKMAIGIVDLNDLDHPKFAGLNDVHMMYAASLPKIAILYTVMYAINNGEITETAAINKDMHDMISISSNAAATRLIDLVGFKEIENLLKNVKPKLYDEANGGGLWVGKRYGSGGGRNPDPLMGLSHAATTIQVCNFYYQLVYGKLINEERSSEMLEILKDPKLSHKFVNTLKTIAPNASIYRKSGSWKNYHSDSALVWGPDRQYILVALIDDPNGEMIIRSLVKPLETALKKARTLND